jgi:hypothetical protein
MWSHYADYHRGICLEFDGHGLLTQHALKVNYSHDRPLILRGDSNELKLDKALLTKSSHWSYEKEWRLIQYTAGPGVVKFRPENLTGIVVGAEAPMSTLKFVRRLNAQRLAPLRLFKARISRETFSVEVRVIAS